ncbi:MAG: FAD-linked oxidoreductase [Acidobacteria bacterium 13_2_20CM_58_27]|nr:MAG: FAD-linked oxidoreductase [Acidobacteria bacterium 13_2_20CM_58_27]
MDRRTFLKRSGMTAFLQLWPPCLFASKTFRRRRPSDADWPSKAAWKRLNDALDGNLIPVEFPIDACIKDADGTACKNLIANIKNPYYIGEHPGLTQTLGWVDAWFTKPSVFAVAAKDANHVAAAIQFARENDLRLVLKGGGHSYQGTSNAPDSLLVWTRQMHDVLMHEAFVPEGCDGKQVAQRAVTCGSGAIWMQAYDAVTTKAGAYVQGGGCTTVGVAGLVQSGGFGSFSKHYGTCAAGLLEAEVVTADGKIRIANACANPDLFWALKGGGGGTFGVVTKVTLRVHELPEYAGGAIFRVKASSDDAFRRLLRYFVGFYRENLFNDHWGEQAHIGPDNVLGLSMVSLGLSTEEARKVWQPFLDWIARSPGVYTVEPGMILGSMPARHWWDVAWRKEQHQHVFDSDARPGASENNVWWTGDGGQVAWTIYGFESLWLPASLLGDDLQEQLANALFAGSRYELIELHFNKGLAGAPREAIEAARDTATNPAVLNAFALAIVADGQGGYPGVRGHEPDVEAGRKSRERVHGSMNELRTLTPNGGSYVSESNFFEKDWSHSYWGSNYARLASVKKKYDPTGLFFVHNGVGSEEWSADGFTKL